MYLHHDYEVQVLIVASILIVTLHHVLGRTFIGLYMKWLFPVNY